MTRWRDFWSNLATLGKMKNFWTIGHEFQDDSGTIEMAELVEIIGTLYEMEVVKLSKLPLFQLKDKISRARDIFVFGRTSDKKK